MEGYTGLSGFILVLSILVSIYATGVVSTGGVLEIYVDERTDVVHRAGDPVYLSIADGYVVLRILVSRELRVVNVSIVIGEETVSMKPQLYLLNAVMWYGVVRYDEKGFSYYFKLRLVDNTEIAVYRNRDSREFYFDGVDRYPQVEWVKSSIGYQIFPDRFHNGDPGNDHYGLIYDRLLYDNTTRDRPVLSNWSSPPHPTLHCCHQYFGGDLRGILMKLDYLRELGVNVIYMTPIFLCGSIHCYDTYDYYQIHPRLGTLEDLYRLINESKRHGIRLIFDFVPGHVGLGFWAFQDVYVKGPESEYWDWFTIYRYPFTPGNGNHYRCWWGIGSLPQLNTTNPVVKRYLVNAALYWLDIGFDGVRIDTPLDLLNPREFFNELRAVIKSRYPGKYIVGEIWETRPEWVNQGPFDSLMNYALGKDILVEYVKGRYSDNIEYILSQYYSVYSVSAAGMGFNIIGSHDTDRVLTMLGGGRLFPEPRPPVESIVKLKMLSTLQYTQPGMPVVFQGDERGIPGIRAYPYEEHRYPIQWDRVNEDVLKHYRELGWIKRNLRALHTSIIRIFQSPSGVLAYTRGYDDEVLVLANNRNEKTTYRLPSELTGVNWVLVYTSSGEKPIIGDEEVTIPPLTTIILAKREYIETTPTPTTPVTETPTPTTPVTETTPTAPTPINITETPIGEEYIEEEREEAYLLIPLIALIIVATAISLVYLKIRRR